MKLCSSDSPISRTLRPLVGLFELPFGYLPTLQAHSSRSLNNSFSHHPQVAQRKQRDQLRRVFDQSPIPSLAVAELALDHPEGVFHLGPNAGLDLFQLVDQGVYSFVLLQSPPLARHHGNLPVNPRVLRLNLFALGDTPVAGVCEYNIFFTVQQGVGLRDVMLIGGSARNSMNQARLSVCANVSLHTEVPLVALLGLVHLWVTLTRAVLGGARSCDQSGINDRACFEQQAPLDQIGVHGGKNLRGEVVGFKQVTESENGALIRQPRGACVKLGELTKQGYVMQCLFHGRIRQAKPLLHEMNAKHCGNGKRRTARFACGRKGLNQASQLRPRHNKIHLVEKLTLACSLGDQFKSGGGEGGLFHLDITFKSGATMTFAELP